MNENIFLNSITRFYLRREHITFLEELIHRTRTFGKIKIFIDNKLYENEDCFPKVLSSMRKIKIKKKIYRIIEEIEMEIYSFDTMVFYFMSENLEITFDNIKIYSEYLEKDNGNYYGMGKMIDLHIFQRENEISFFHDGYDDLNDERKEFLIKDVEEFYNRKDQYYKKLKEMKKKN